MALRIHLAGARNTTPEAFLEALEDFDLEDLREERGWVYLLASVWGIGGKDLDKALRKLSGPSFRATTVDGEFWQLRLFKGKKLAFETEYHFYYADPYEEFSLEDWEDDYDDEGEAEESLLYRVARETFGISKKEAQECEGLPPHEVIPQLVKFQAKKIQRALEDLQIPHIPEEVMDVLTGKSVTTAEFESDVGNLPRFLNALGLTDFFREYEEAFEEEEEEIFDDEGRELQHIIAFFGALAEDFEEKLAALPLQMKRVENGWFRAAAGRGTLVIEDLKEALNKFRGSGFWVNRHYEEWTLHLWKDGKNFFILQHNPSEIGDQNIKSWEERLMYNDNNFVKMAQESLHLPPGISRKWESLPLSESLPKLKEAYGNEVIAALDQMAISYDRDLVFRVFTGQESDWAVGDLPFFLKALGLNEIIPQWIEAHPLEEGGGGYVHPLQGESEEEDELDQWEREASKKDYVARVMEKVDYQSLPLSDPLPLRYDQFPLLYWIGLFIDDEADSVVFIDLPGGEKVELDWFWKREVQLGDWKGRQALGFERTALRWATLKNLKKVVRLLGKLPEGSHVELVVHSEFQGARQIYGGKIKDGQWYVHEIFPAIKRESLERALKLAEDVEKCRPLKGESLEDASRILKGCEQDVHLKDYEIYLEGLTFKAQGGHGDAFFYPLMGQRIFRHRFREIWYMKDREEAEEKALLEAEEWEKQVLKVGSALAGGVGVPHRGEVIFEGTHTSYQKVQLPTHPLLDHVKQSRIDDKGGDFGVKGMGKLLGEAFSNQREEEEAHQRMEELGFIHIGDMVCEAFPDMAMRAYAREDGDAYGIVSTGTLGQFVYEFYSRFEDGSSLTTTIGGVDEDREDRKIYKRVFPGLSLEELYQKHRDGLEDREFRGNFPRETSLKLVEFARWLDEFLLRGGYIKQ